MDTMEWTKQTEDLFKTWTDAQTKMWSDWLKTMQGFGKSQSSQVWEKSVDAWDESIKKILDAQADWTERWADSFTTAKGAPKEMVEWSKQGQEMIKHLTDTQKMLWTNWFAIVRKLDPAALGVNWGDGQTFQKSWQQAIQKGLSTQEEWVRQWGAGQGGKRSK
jgi:hypothetical protein